MLTLRLSVDSRSETLFHDEATTAFRSAPTSCVSGAMEADLVVPKPEVPDSLMATKDEEGSTVEEKLDSPVFDFDGGSQSEANLVRSDGSEQAMQSCKGITDKETLRQRLLTAFDLLCDEYGGPAQWLLHKFKHSEDDFRASLTSTFPWMASIDYAQPAVLGKKDRSFVHVSTLSFSQESSTKGLPYRGTCRHIVEEILMHGFSTEAEPLILWCSPDDRLLSQAHFRCRYVKGSARCVSLLSLLALFQDLEVDVMVHFPYIYQSVQVIHVLFQAHGSITSVAIANAHLSCAGSIRQAHDVMTWVNKLRRLEGGADTPAAILEKFNSSATSKGRVTGNRRVAALALLQPECKRGCEMMVDLLSMIGSRAVWWAEDSFCNKKLLPNFTPRTGRSSWNPILAVTEESFCMWIESLNRQHLAKNPRSRRTLEKSRLEEHSQLSAFWTWATIEARQHAVDPEELQALHQKFLDGEVALTLQLQSLLHERKSDICWKDVPLG